jgi:hypothetical protein
MATAKNKAVKKSAKKAAKKAAKKKSANKSTGGRACWPGFQRVPGTEAGTKGSCEPKSHQTPAEKRADSRAAAARKRERGE